MIKSKSENTPISSLPSNKRTLLKALAGGSASIAISNWSQPLIHSVLLPAHAETTIEPPAPLAPIMFTGEGRCPTINPLPINDQYYTISFATAMNGDSDVPPSSIVSHGNTDPGNGGIDLNNYLLFLTYKNVSDTLHIQLGVRYLPGPNSEIFNLDGTGSLYNCATPPIIEFEGGTATGAFALSWQTLSGGTSGAPTIELSDFRLSLHY